MRGVPLPPPRETDAAVLVDRVRAGDAGAEEELVAQFERRVWFALRRRLHDREASRELVNDVLMAVLRAVRDGRLRDAARLPGFVYGTARNLANNYLRALLLRPPEEPLAAHLSIVDPVADREHDERLAAVRRGLEGLDTTAREIVLMTLLDGLKPSQIASRLGLSPEIVRARKSRAVRKLAAVVLLAGGCCATAPWPGARFARVTPERGARHARVGPQRGEVPP